MPRKTSNVYELKRPRGETREQALERLYREHAAPLRSFLLGRIRDEDELEDVVSEVFARLTRMEGLLERLPVGRERSNRAYLFTAANNCTVDFERRKAVRRNYRQACEGEVAGQVYELSPDVAVMAQQELDSVKRALAALKPRWRKAFLLNRFKYLSYKEISTEMGVSEKQVQYYISNALVKLRQASSKIPPKSDKSRGWRND